MGKVNDIKTEIDGDPGTYSGLNDKAVADSMNAETVVIKEPVSSANLLAWAGGGSRYMKLKNAADSHADDAIKSIAWAALTMIQRDGTDFDFNKADRAAMLDALVGASVLDPTDKSDLEDLANTNISRATQLNLSEIREGEVNEARRLT